MALGILGLVLSLFCFIGVVPAIPAFILGVQALRECSRDEAGGRGMAIAGIVMSQISIILAVLTGLVFLTGGSA